MTLRQVLRATTRGLVGAMAMSGMRQVSTGLGLLERTPPEDIVADNLAGPLTSLAEGQEQAAVELAHWTYGALAGTAFGLLPHGFRRSAVAGPAYGTAVWLGFELVVAPALGLALAERRTLSSRLVLVADHLLYGVIVAGQLAPEAERGRTSEDEQTPVGGARPSTAS